MLIELSFCLLVIVIALILIIVTRRKISIGEPSDFYDEAYFINLKDHTRRHQNFKNRSKHAKLGNIVRFDAVDTRDGKYKDYQEYIDNNTMKRLQVTIKNGIRKSHEDLQPGAIGCYLSHLFLYEKALQSGKTVIFVMEDDVDFVPGFARKFRECMKVAPNDFDILLLGWSNQGSIKAINTCWVKVSRFFQTHAYIITKKGMEKVIQFTNNSIRMQIDALLSRFSHKLNIYGVQEKLTYQESTDTIQLYNVKSIPKNIMQTWKTNILPIQFQQYQKQLIELNKSFSYNLFTDKDVNMFMETMPQKWKTFYDNLPFLIQKLDFFRYCILFQFGGFYADIDYECKESFEKDWEHFHPNVIVAPEEYRWNIVKFRQMYPDFETVSGLSFKGDEPVIFLGNYALLTSEKSDAMRRFINFLIQKYHDRNQNLFQMFDHQRYIFYTTGPYILTEYFYRFPADFMVLPRDESNQNYQFGRYGIHHPMGSWMQTKLS
jgi:GR25 family glycosyltransferase involved in LPS biosynthesis